MSAQSVAQAHYRTRARLARALEREAARLWRHVDAGSIARSWETLLPRLMAALVEAQRTAAGQSDAYLSTVLAAQGITAAPVRVDPAAFVGVASDGRSLGMLLRQPVITSKVAILAGAAPARALVAGQAALQTIVATQVADAGRVADGVALTGQRRTTGYVRMVVGKTCSRCIILAGKRYRWNQGFDRHPKCDCIHIPAAEDAADDLRTDPRQTFDSMTPAEQDRVFTKAGAESIRRGADINQVVNARQGMYTAGGQLRTTTGATRRGFAGQRLGAPRGRRAIRLMPEQILHQAGGDRAEAVRLLRLHGYLI